MKKLLFGFAWLFGLSTGVQAQVKLGLKIMPQLTWTSVETKNLKADANYFNFAYGLILDKHFSENYSISTEIVIANFKGDLKPQNTTLVKDGATPATDVSYEYTLQYFSVPLYLKMRTNEIGYLRYYAEFGLNNCFLGRARADVSSSSVNLTDVNINDPDDADKFDLTNGSGKNLEDEVNFYRASLLIGAGIQYNAFANTLLFGGVRYDRGFTSFTKESSWDARLNGLCLNVGVLF